MKAGLRFTIAYLAAALALAPVGAHAQEAAPPPTTNTATPATDAVGPRELQNFNLSGRVTRPADRPATTQPAPATRTTQAPASRPPAASTATPRTPPVRTATNNEPRPERSASADSAPAAASVATPAPQRPPAASSVTVDLPKLGDSAKATIPTPSPAPGPAFAPDPRPANLTPDHGFGMLPWLLAAVALAGGGLFLFWRSRTREAFAGGPLVDDFVAPQPAPRPAPVPRPAPQPAPAPPAPPSASIPGIVSTRLRPWIEIGFQPLRCVVDGNQVVVEFEAELFNSGSAAARAVLAEASLFNAGPAQDQDLGTFFANPVGAGERIVEIGPLKRIALRSQVVAPLTQIQRYELGGHEVFVPVIAFNALYRWSSGEGQTSVSYLLGRDTQSDKLGPFRLDLGARVFRGLAARQLPTGIRQ
jgi:hypothetical protein